MSQVVVGERDPADFDEKVRLKPLPLLIFSSRWLQLPLYVGLIVAQIVYVYLFLKELRHLIIHAWEFTEQQIMLVVLGSSSAATRPSSPGCGWSGIPTIRNG